MNDTVGNKNIGGDNTSVVHKDAAVTDGDGKVLAVGSSESSAILKSR